MIGYRLPRRINAGDESICHVRFLGFDQIQRPGRVGVRTDQGGTGDQGGQQSEREAADPEERRVAEQRRLLCQASYHVEVVLVFEQSALGVDGALRVSGGAGGVDDRHRIGLLDIGLQAGNAITIEGGRVEDDVAQLGQPPEVECHAEHVPIVVTPKAWTAQQNAHIAVRQLPVQLGSGGECRERDHHRTDAGGGQHTHHKIGPVRIKQSDVGALTRTQRDQSAGEACRKFFGLRITEPVAVAHQQPMITQLPSMGDERWNREPLRRHRNDSAPREDRVCPTGFAE